MKKRSFWDRRIPFSLAIVYMGLGAGISAILGHGAAELVRWLING